MSAQTLSQESRASDAKEAIEQPVYVDFAFKVKRTGLAFVAVGEWEIMIDGKGITTKHNGTGNPKTSPVFHHIEFGQILGNVDFKAADNGPKINKLEKKVRELQAKLVIAEQAYQLEKEKNHSLRTKVQEFQQETFTPLVRRAALNNSRDQLLRCYSYCTKHRHCSIKTLTRRLAKPDPKLSASLKEHFFGALRDEDRHTILKDIHAAAKRVWPQLELETVKMACGDNPVRQAGNKAAHEFDDHDVEMALTVNTEDLDEGSLNTLQNLFECFQFCK